ncbi:MAG: hypothetical protein ACQKBV_04040 [Puniceicoccales bacterium]
MKHTYFLCSLALLGSAQVSAAILEAIPTPVQQGGMIHTMVTFTDQPTGTFSIMQEPGIPVMQPLTAWSPGDTFDPADPWYTTLDPSQGDLPFNSQYGLMVNGGASDPLPGGKSLGIRVTDIDAGLEGYFYSTAGAGTFDLVLGDVGDAVQWSGNMWHPVFVADGPGSYDVTLQFFIIDAPFSGFVSPTSALADPNFAMGEVTLTLTAVPEPSTYALAVGFVCLGAVMLIRRKRK